MLLTRCSVLYTHTHEHACECVYTHAHTPPPSLCALLRILILVRQPDPRFTPRVWLPPIVHCQGILMERQQWIPSPHKWLSDRAPSSITSYNVEVQKMRPSGGLIWCFICSFEKLLSFFSLSLCTPYLLLLLSLQNNKRVHTCTYVNRINLCKNSAEGDCLLFSVLFLIRWPGCRQRSNITLLLPDGNSSDARLIKPLT